MTERRGPTRIWQQDIYDWLENNIVKVGKTKVDMAAYRGIIRAATSH